MGAGLLPRSKVTALTTAKTGAPGRGRAPRTDWRVMRASSRSPPQSTSTSASAPSPAATSRDRAGEHVERADARRPLGREHHVAGADPGPHPGAGRRLDARQAPVAAGGAQPAEGEALVLRHELELDERAGLVAPRGDEVEPRQHLAAGPLAATRPAASTTTSVASRATSATEWLT